jgi:hypothetical protein
MKAFTKGCLVFLLSISLILQGCAQTISSSYSKGKLISTTQSDKAEEISRETKIELISPTSVKVKNVVEYGKPVVYKYEKIEEKYIGTPRRSIVSTIFLQTVLIVHVLFIVPFICAAKPSGCLEELREIGSPYECKKEEDKARCNFTTEKIILPDEFEQEKTYENTYTLEGPVTSGNVKVVMKKLE